MHPNLTNYLWPCLQKGDDNIMVVMLKFRQNLVDEKFSHPLNLENDIFTKLTVKSCEPVANNPSSNGEN